MVSNLFRPNPTGLFLGQIFLDAGSDIFKCAYFVPIPGGGEEEKHITYVKIFRHFKLLSLKILPFKKYQIKHNEIVELPN